jgi:2-iminobutanoate/2-iminopropanoate deaminase
MGFEPISTQGTPSSHLPFSPAVRAGEFVFVSGQASVDDEGKLVGDTFEGQMRRSFENVRRILASAGLTLGDVVQVRSYVRDPDDLADYNRIYREYFSSPYPARSTITNCLPPSMRFEVDVVAYAGSSAR